MVEYEIQDQGKHKVIVLQGEVDLYCVGDLKKDLIKEIEAEGGSESVVVDMTDLKYMDSSGIALMANMQKKVKASNARFALISVNDDIMNVLRLSALDSFFSIYENLDQIP